MRVGKKKKKGTRKKGKEEEGKKESVRDPSKKYPCHECAEMGFEGGICPGA